MYHVPIETKGGESVTTGVFLHRNFKPIVMSENDYRGQLNVAVQGQRSPNMRVMNGRALLDVDGNDFKFVENAPRGPRSVEVGRTMHSRFVRRPDGLYTVTLRLAAGTKYLREAITAEIADIIKAIELDSQVEKAKRKEAENGEKKG